MEPVAVVAFLRLREIEAIAARDIPATRISKIRYIILRCGNFMEFTLQSRFKKKIFVLQENLLLEIVTVFLYKILAI